METYDHVSPHIIAILTVALFTSSAMAMSHTNDTTKDNDKKIAVGNPEPPNTTNAITVYKQETKQPLSRHKSLDQILYDKLDPMPRDLINIIIDYDSYEFKGACATTINEPLPPTCLAILSDEQLASASEIGKQINCLNLLTTQKTVLKTPSTQWQLRHMTYLGDDKFAYQAGRKIAIITIANGTLNSIETPKNCRPRCISNMVAGLFATAEYLGAIKLWDATTGERLATVPANGKQYPCCLRLFSHNQLVVGNCSGCIQLLNLAGTPQWTTLAEQHKKGITCFARLSDTCIASGSEDETIKFWDLQTHECIGTLSGHRGSITCLLPLENSQLASGSKDGTVIIWNLDTGAGQHLDLKSPVLSMCRLPNGPLVIGIKPSIALAPDGQHSAPNKSRGELQIWR